MTAFGKYFPSKVDGDFFFLKEIITYFHRLWLRIFTLSLTNPNCEIFSFDLRNNKLLLVLLLLFLRFNGF